MNDANVDLDPAEFLTAIHNNLHKTFFGTHVSEFKNAFRKLAKGKTLPFMTISTPEKDEVNCVLALDHTLFVGDLNFNRFRNLVTAHLRRISDALAKKEDLNMLTNDETGDTLFYLPGAVEEGGVLNVLVTAVEQRTAGNVTVRLMFLDPSELKMKSG
jgi:hypothetical protein